jgi:hypothetical protein
MPTTSPPTSAFRPAVGGADFGPLICLIAATATDIEDKFPRNIQGYPLDLYPKLGAK